MIPYAQIVLQKKQLDTQFSSAMIVKKIQKNKQSRTQIDIASQRNINLYNYDDEVYLIQFKLCQKKTKINVNINYIEIDNYLKESNQYKKNKILDELNKQLISKEFAQKQNKQNAQNFEQLISFQFLITDRNFTNNNLETLNLLSMKSQEDLKYHRSSKRNFKNEIQQSHTIKEIFYENEDFKEQQNLTNFQSGCQLTPMNSNQRHDCFDQQIENLNLISKNEILSSKNEILSSKNNILSSKNDIFSCKNFSSNEGRNKEIPKMILQLKQTHSRSLKNIIDFTPSPTFQSHDTLFQQTNYQNDLNQMITTNSKRNIEQGSQNFEYSTNNLQPNQNIIDQYYFNGRNGDHLLAKQLVNKQTLVDFDHIQKTLTDSDQCLSIEDNLFSKRKTKSTNCQDEEKEHKKEQQIEIASVNSSRYSSENFTKRNMIRRINKKEFTKSLKAMIITGFLAIIILIFVTLIVYLQNLSCLDNFVASFLKIDGTIFCFTDVMKILAVSNYQTLLGNPYIQDSQEVQDQDNILVNNQIEQILQNYNNNFQDLVLRNDSTEQLDDLQNNPFKIKIFAYRFYDHKEIDESSTTKYIQSLQYTIMRFYYEIVFYIIKYQDEQESFIWGNMVHFKQRMKNLQQIVEDYAQTQFDKMDTQQMSVITLVSILSFLVIFSIIPLSIYIQYKREKVMKLFGTFQPSILEFQIQLIELAIYKIDKTKMVNSIDKKLQGFNQSNKFHNIKRKNIYIKNLMEQALELNSHHKSSSVFKNQMQQIPKYIRRMKKTRNRSIASFNSLPKFNIIIVCLGIIAVLMLCIQPTLNIIQFSPFQVEQKAVLQDRITLIDIFTLIVENQASHIESILTLISLNVNPSNAYYYTYAKNLTEQNEIAISNLQNLTTNLGIKRHNQDVFDEFYKNILNQDVCQVRLKFPQYFQSNITEEDCDRLFNGILKRGLILSINKVFLIFYELLEMYSIQDLDSQLDFFVSFQKQFSYVDFKLLIQVISESVDAIRQYYNESLQDSQLYLKDNLLKLFIVQLFIITLLFFVGWLRLFRNFVDQLLKTKSIFKAFHINVLYENEHIQSYFRQRQIQIKH